MSGLVIALAIWVLLALAVLVLLFYRSRVAAHEDDTLHVSHDTELVAEQAVLATKLGTLDKWGKILTVIAGIYGLVLLGYYVAVTAILNTSRGI